ncbi:MAG: hypothetical protein JW959_10755 [Pirellulales bacterium]|nr:hypothetical protein [Pirellulales bacterium]
MPTIIEILLIAAVLCGAQPNADVRADTATNEYVVEWESPTPRRPWLKSVKIASVASEPIEISPIDAPGMLPNGALVRVLGRQGAGGFRIELYGGYGFTLSAELLNREPFVWLKDLGVIACRRGELADLPGKIEALEERAAEARKKPFRSTSEIYYAWTGYDVTRRRKDDRAFEFAYRLPREPAPRSRDSIAAMPEADYRYFLDRVQDPPYRVMFLGWPNVCQEFGVLSNGEICVSANASRLSGHPPAEHFAVRFGVGDEPRFKEYGDRSVVQELEDGYHTIVRTRWKSDGAAVRAAACVYPLDGEEVRTGNEPLAAFVRVVREGGSNEPLWLKILPDQEVSPIWPVKKIFKPIKNLAAARVDGSTITAGDRVVLGFDSVRAVVASADEKEVLVRLEPDEDHVDLMIPYVAVDAELVGKARAMGFDEALKRTKRYWDRRLSSGARIETPDATVNNLYKTFLPRTLCCAELDAEGDYVLKTSPLVYDAVWLHITALGIEGLSRRGHFDDARRYLETAFRWQGSQGPDSEHYSLWKGFFNTPPRYTVWVWLNYHGWTQWAAARYFLFSDDKQWLNEKLPALVESLEWTVEHRRKTKRENPDGTRPLNYGWLPAGRVNDGATGTSACTDCVNWMGFNELALLLERFGHPRAAEFRREADDYRACILDGLRRASVLREPVKLNDGAFVPYVPGYLESTGHEQNMWFAAVVDVGQNMMLDSGVMPSGEPMEDWVLANCEDNLFSLAPNLADEAYFVGQGHRYIRRDETKMALYTFYSLMASGMSRQTLTTFEHRSWGKGKAFDLAPWAMCNYTRFLAAMLALDDGDELVYCKATPRAWLAPGKQISADGLQTRFGPTIFKLIAEENSIHGEFELPTRYPPKSARLVLRTDGKIKSVAFNEKSARFDPATESVALPIGVGKVTLRAEVER